MQIRRIEGDDAEAAIHAAGHLFDSSPTTEATRRFVRQPGHYLLFAYEDGMPVGFATGIEMAHPDKGVELMLYELGVDDAYRRRGIGAALVAAMRSLATELGCYGMWTLTETDNEAALATYSSASGTNQGPQVMFDWDLAPRTE